MIRARRAAATVYFDDDNEDGAAAPTWIMGLPYTELREEERRSDIFSTMWVTYRSGFPRMEPYGYTDDSGWGCMLRSAQMLMSQALQRHSLGRLWRVPRTLEERLRVPEYRRLLHLFADCPGEESLFSIHNMCQVGIRYDKLPGEWYGPTTAACVLRDIAELYANKPIPPPLLRQNSTSRRCPPPARNETSENGRRLERGTVDRDSNGDLPALAEGDAKTRSASGSGLADAEGGDGPTSQEGTDSSQPWMGVDGKEGRLESAYSPRGGEQGKVGLITTGIESPDSLPSFRPLRVFVSQGDVVYIDEVEAMAFRGEGGFTRNNGVSTGKRSEEGAIGYADENGGFPDDDCRAPAAEEAGSASDLSGRETRPSCDVGESSGRSSPAFFDPLLNPGDGMDNKEEKKAWASAVVLLVPLRLGLDELSAGYIPGLLRMLQVPQSLGFLGGRPNHATFWIGAQGDTLTGLDPHTTQAAPDMCKGFPSERYMHSLHCHYPVTMDVRRIDPSLALAFYVPDRKSFEDLTQRIRSTIPPPFSVEQTRPDYEGEMGLASMINQRDDDGTTDDEEDEYVFVKGPER